MAIILNFGYTIVLLTMSSTEIDKPKVAKIAKGNMRSSGRRILADNTNFPQQPYTPKQPVNPHESSDTIREHNKQLQKVHFFFFFLLWWFC